MEIVEFNRNKLSSEFQLHLERLLPRLELLGRVLDRVLVPLKKIISHHKQLDQRLYISL